MKTTDEKEKQKNLNKQTNKYRKKQGGTGTEAIVKVL